MAYCWRAERECDALHRSSSINDLGFVVGKTMTDSEVSSTVSGLTAGLKYTLLTNHYRPGNNFVSKDFQ